LLEEELNSDQKHKIKVPWYKPRPDNEY